MLGPQDPPSQGCLGTAGTFPERLEPLGEEAETLQSLPVFLLASPGLEQKANTIAIKLAQALSSPKNGAQALLPTQHRRGEGMAEPGHGDPPGLGNDTGTAGREGGDCACQSTGESGQEGLSKGTSWLFPVLPLPSASSRTWDNACAAGTGRALPTAPGGLDAPLVALWGLQAQQ